MSIKVKKVKVAKGRTLEVTMTEYLLVNEIPAQNEVVKKCEYLVHQDLIDAFEKLHSHMVNICELDCSKDLVKVTGFTLCDGNDGEAVVLVGSKTLGTGKVLNLVAPITEFHSGEYEYGAILNALVDKCVEEVELYINEGKSAVKQTAINFDEDDEGSEVNIGEGEAPKKKRGRKNKNVMTISVDGGEEIPVELDKAM